MHRYNLKTIIFTLILIFIIGKPGRAYTVQAQGESAYDLINAVNEFRASYDLAPYEIDQNLMGIAQAHSEYQASIKKNTHERADGTGPGDHGISSENIGGGYNATSQILIHYQWTDYWHTHTLIGYTSGLVGAGLASDASGYLYYTLVVKNTGRSTGLPGTATPGGESKDITTLEPVISVLTATPQEDGAVIHEVQAGQTLWEIALSYDTTVAELAAFNGLDVENPIIYIGQTLYIRLPNTPTATATITNTPLPPTRTLRPSRTPQPPKATPTEIPTIVTTTHPLVPDSTIATPVNLQKLGLIIIVITFLGVGAILFSKIWSQK
ncbi:MAG: LysM peptidoglycan-binding domain-containing protein [Anaerolineaceae bacterium]|nr:LysM peptidoglycan-binding domain-containing protein [Anaerolineaceae bacterium]